MSQISIPDPVLPLPEITWTTRTETLCMEGDPVLDYKLTWPQFPRDTPVLHKLDRLYTRMAAHWEAYWTKTAFPEACQALTRQRAVSRPFRPWSGGLQGEVTLHREDLLSLRFEGWEQHGDNRTYRVTWGDTWNLFDGSPCSPRTLLGREKGGFRALYSQLLTQGRERQTHGTQFFLPHWEQRMKKYFPRYDVWLTPEGICLPFPQNSISPAAEGTPFFTIPGEIAVFSQTKKFFKKTKKRG